MNQQVKEQWIAALRSGKYKQCTGKLCSVSETGERAYCCLGVLTELFCESEEGQKANIEWEDTNRGYLSFNGHTQTPSYRVGLWAEFDSYALNPIPLGYDKPIAILNDNGKTFEEIADIIEAGL